MIRSISLAFAALTLGAVVGSAAAAPTQSIVERQVVVSYGDLDPAVPHDAAILRERIAQAAMRACGGKPDFATYYRDAPRFAQKNFEKCRQAAFADALARIETQVSKN